jgi:hypothetical protein
MLSFVSINIDELVKGTKYRIEENLFNVKELIIVGIFNGYEEKYLLWNKTFYFNNYNGYEVIIPKYVESMRMDILHKRKFYKLISSKEKIQNAMELRAINLILQNIIDKTFIY